MVTKLSRGQSYVPAEPGEEKPEILVQALAKKDRLSPQSQDYWLALYALASPRTFKVINFKQQLMELPNLASKIFENCITELLDKNWLAVLKHDASGEILELQLGMPKAVYEKIVENTPEFGMPWIENVEKQ